MRGYEMGTGYEEPWEKDGVLVVDVFGASHHDRQLRAHRAFFPNDMRGTIISGNVESIGVDKLDPMVERFRRVNRTTVTKGEP